MPTQRKDLERLYSRYRQPLFTCALVITGSPSMAEDAVHEAFCRLLRSEHLAPNNLKAYVFRAVRNAALDVVRRAKHWPELLPDFVFDPCPEPSYRLAETEFKQQVVDLMKCLRPDERETIVQHLYGELTFQEIATIRECPLGTVVSWYRRGLEKLRQKAEVSDGSI